jgi:putative copper export protein
MTMAQVRGLVLETTWGRGWTAQLVTALAALACWPLVRRAGGRMLGLGAGIVLAAALADAHTGHGMAGRWAGAIGASLHLAHLLGGGIWIGSLGIASWIAFTPAPGDEPTSRATWQALFSAFAPWAMVGGGLVVVSGAVMGVEYAGGWSRLFTDTYGQVLLAKAALAGLILLAGAWHWRFAVPGLSRAGTGAGFRWSVRAELAIAWVVVAITAVLVALPAPGV